MKAWLCPVSHRAAIEMPHIFSKREGTGGRIYFLAPSCLSCPAFSLSLDPKNRTEATQGCDDLCRREVR